MRILDRTYELADRMFGTSLSGRRKKRKAERKSRKKWRTLTARFPVPDRVETEIRDVLSDIDFYWTPVEKQVVMASLIIQHDLQNAVEIGVYTGGSLMPQAVAMKHTGGVAIGIDPYSAAEAEQKDNRDRLHQADPAILNPDRDEMYDSVVNLIERRSLSGHCRILKATSNDASSDIADGIDMLHIDGNHDLVRVTDDLTNYLPKLRVGGFLVIDDINWGTIAPLYSTVKQQMEIIYETETWGCCRKTQDAISLT